MEILRRIQNNLNKVEEPWEDENGEICFGNRTNPNSIYILGRLKFKGYNLIELDFFVDTGSSLCLASKNVIPEHLWENAPHPIKAKIADGSEIKLDKIVRDLTVFFAGTDFTIAETYQQETGLDFLLGNNFCQKYEPFVQYSDRIYLTKINPNTGKKETVLIQKKQVAYQNGLPGFLESKKKRSKVHKPEPINITPQKTESYTTFLEGGKVNVSEQVFSSNLDKIGKIRNLLEQVCSENPLDPEKTKRWMKASIKLIEPGKVVKVKPMIYSPDDRLEFTKQIKELLDMKLIEPSKSPFMSPAFLVNNDAEKRRGKKRMVINYKKVNEITVSDSHNLPKRDELIALIRDKQIFSSFDCKSGFWQVLLDNESKPITAFTCPDGHYQWNVVPFGLKQAPSIFQRHMQNAYRGFEKFCCIYVDDILVFSNDEQEHYKHVAAVLKRTKELGIILSLKKAQLFKSDIVFLGIRIKEGKHVPQNHILDNLHKFPDKLEDKKQLQRFFGILTYAETYIPDLAKMKSFLNAKLKKDSIWSWSNEDTHIMQKIKKKLIKFPELYLPRPEDQMIIETDASDKHWGGVLKAKTNSGEELICRYTSGSFKPAEINYHSSEKEILAVIRVITKFSIYLTPVVFTVRSDYKNLKDFLNLNMSGDRHKGRLVRWQAFLSHYTFNVEFIKGYKNVLADCLSRELAED